MQMSGGEGCCGHKCWVSAAFSSTTLEQDPGGLFTALWWGRCLQSLGDISCSTIFIETGLFAIKCWLCAEKTIFSNYLVLNYENIWLYKENERGREKKLLKQALPPLFYHPRVPRATGLPFSKALLGSGAQPTLAQTRRSLPGQAYLPGELSSGGSVWGKNSWLRKEGVLWDRPARSLVPGAKVARGGEESRAVPCHAVQPGCSILAGAGATEAMSPPWWF